MAGYQRWRDLLFLHWRIDQETLRPLVPSCFQLDLFQGHAYLGIVHLLMRDIRPHRLWPAGWGLNFGETNVRTYVSYQGRPGILFFSLDASSRLAVWGARSLWNLPYFFGSSRTRRDGERVDVQVQRSSGPRFVADYLIGPTLPETQPETTEFFFLERYLLFVAQSDRVYAGQIHHTPYPVREVQIERVEDELIAAAGFPRVDRQSLALAHFSPGVDVEIFALESQ